MDWFLYDNGLRHERVKAQNVCFSVFEEIGRPFMLKMIQFHTYQIV